MSRLRNRMVKADFYTDPDLLQWPRQKRDLYRSLWAMAEDSYCIEDSPFGWKVTAWPSPLDDDMSIEAFGVWRDELIADGKLIPYECGGKRYLFLPDMARHENPRNPQSPTLPLPPFVKWVQHASDARKGCYEVAWNVVQPLYNNATTLPALPCPALSCPDLGGSVSATPPTFDECYNAYPFHRFEDEARAAFDAEVASGTDPALILAACKAAPSTRQSLGKFISERTWRDHIPKARRAPCTNPECINGFIMHGDEAHPCPDCKEVADG